MKKNLDMFVENWKNESKGKKKVKQKKTTHTHESSKRKIGKKGKNRKKYYRWRQSVHQYFRSTSTASTSLCAYMLFPYACYIAKRRTHSYG